MQPRLTVARHAIHRMKRFIVITSLSPLLDGPGRGRLLSSPVLVRDLGHAATSVELPHASSAWTLQGWLRIPAVLLVGLVAGPVALAVDPVALAVDPVALAVDPVAGPVVLAVDPVADPVVLAVDPVAGPVAGPVALAVDPVAGLALARLLPARLAAVLGKALVDPDCRLVDSDLALVSGPALALLAVV